MTGTTDLKNSYTSYAITDETTNERHLLISYKEGDICPYNASRRYGLDVEIKCNPAIDTYNFIALNSTDYCNPRVVLQSKHGCPVFSATIWLRILSNHPYLLGIAMLIFGYVATYYGREYFRSTVGLIGGATTFFLMMLILSHLGFLDYLDPITKTGSLVLSIISVLLALFVALVVGVFFAYEGFIFGMVVVGMLNGLLTGVILYNLIFYGFHSDILLLVLCVLGALINGYLAFAYQENIMIYGTAFIGAYSLIRGISLFLGYFPNELLLYSHLSKGFYIPLPW